MDRLGTRRVALFFVWTAMALAPAFPLLPWFWPLLLLQVIRCRIFGIGGNDPTVVTDFPSSPLSGLLQRPSRT